ncbi:MAG TPA: PsbP-related protein [Candidatus Omnitrophota bacterium]|nr:PsbP-related protein [Candidatus Omnitrophota bacterium]
MMRGRIKRLVALCSVCILAGSVHVHAQQVRTYTNKNLHFKLQYPADFQVKTINGAIILSSPLKSQKDTFAESVNIVTLGADRGVNNLKDFYGQARKSMQETMLKVKIIEDKKITLGGKEAYLLVYTSLRKKTTFKFMQVMTMNDRLVYVVTYTALPETYEEYLRPVKAMLNSFAFVK